MIKRDEAYKQMEEAYDNAPVPEVTFTYSQHYQPTRDYDVPYKYCEGDIIADFKDYIDATYSQHYNTDEQSLQCFDAWIALGESTDTFRNTAIKYLWRYGKKNGNNREDLLKALHYVIMCLYVDHYKNKG